MNFPIGLQLYSVREDLEKDFEGTLRKVKALGYDAVEFAGLFGHGAEEVRNLCKEIGLIPLSAHVPFVDMMNDPDGVLKVYADIGCKFVVIPYLTEEYRPGQPKFQEVIDGAKLLGKKAKELGMQLCYHNHDFEFLKLNGELQWHRSPKIGLTKNLCNGNKERGPNGDIFRHQRNIGFSIKPWII